MKPIFSNRGMYKGKLVAKREYDMKRFVFSFFASKTRSTFPYNPESIMLSEVSQSERDKCHVISL